MAADCVTAKFFRAVTTPMRIYGRDSVLYEVELLTEGGQCLRVACLSEAQQKQVTELLCAATILSSLTSTTEPAVVWDRSET